MGPMDSQSDYSPLSQPSHKPTLLKPVLFARYCFQNIMGNKGRINPRTTIICSILAIIALTAIWSWHSGAPTLPSSNGSWNGETLRGEISRPLHPMIQCMQRHTDADITHDRYYTQANCWNEFRLNEARKLWHDISTLPLSALTYFNLPGNRIQNEYQAFDLIPETYSCDARHMTRIGAPYPIDGGKWLCKDKMPAPDDEKCIIFSLGSANDFSFEEAIHEVAPACKIHTFDCTGDFSNAVTTYHPWCIGGKDDVVKSFTGDGKPAIFKTWDTILNELKIPKVHLLKMDIEVFEWQVLPLLEYTTKPESLPDQILVEIHYDYHVAQYAKSTDHFIVPEEASWNSAKITVELMRVLDRLGYRVARVERNWFCMACAEVVLIRDLTIGMIAGADRTLPAVTA